MVRVSNPGVYIQQVLSCVRTITGVSTSIGAFLDRASKRPIDQAVRLLAIADFTRSFRECHPTSDLVETDQLFFNNDGTDCYVVRIANGAVPAEVALQNLNNHDVLTARAKASGTFGNTIRLEINHRTPNSDETTNLRLSVEDGRVAVQNESFTGHGLINPPTPATPRSRFEISGCASASPRTVQSTDRYPILTATSATRQQMLADAMASYPARRALHARTS